MFSALNIVWFHAEIFLQEIEEYAELSIQSEKITEIQHTLIFASDCFLWKIEHCSNKVKTKFCHQMPTTPFHIMIIPDGNSFVRNVREIRETEELSNPLPGRNFIGPGIPLTRRLEVNPDNGEEEEEEKEEEEEEKQIIIINTDKSFKSDECVICLTKPPSVLFCNCGHLSLRIECDQVKSLVVCPVCKTENTIKRTIEY